MKGRGFNGPDFLQLEEQLWPVDDGKAGLKEVNNSPCIVRWKAHCLLPHDHWVSVFVTRSVFASSRPSNNRNNHCQSQKKVLGSQWEQKFPKLSGAIVRSAGRWKQRWRHSSWPNFQVIVSSHSRRLLCTHRVITLAPWNAIHTPQLKNHSL